MAPARPEVLPHRQPLDSRGGEVGEGLAQLLARLSSPTISPLLVGVCGASALASDSTASERGYSALTESSGEPLDRLEVVVENIGPSGEYFRQALLPAEKSGVSTSTRTPWIRSRSARIVSAKACAPSSGGRRA